jgi:hypothetical protein
VNRRVCPPGGNGGWPRRVAAAPHLAPLLPPRVQQAARRPRRRSGGAGLVACRRGRSGPAEQDGRRPLGGWGEAEADDATTTKAVENRVVVVSTDASPPHPRRWSTSCQARGGDVAPAAAARSSPGTAAASEQPQCLE